MIKETKWLCENASQLEKYAGQWIMFSVRDGVVLSGESLQKILEKSKKRKRYVSPFVFHVPSKDELGTPLPVLLKS